MQHAMQPPATDVDVLIVGAGPVGLFLANECARRSLRWRIVERQARQSEHSKALAVMPRTLEIFDMAGVVEPFLDAANRVTSAAVFASRRNLPRIPFAPQTSPYPFVAMVPQNITERLLAEALHRKGGAIEYDTAFVAAAQSDDGVAVTLERDGTRFSLNAAFVVGCDGAHSTVRHMLDVPFTGTEYRATFMLADVETNAALPGDEMQLCSNENGPLAIFPMSPTRRRIIAAVAETHGDAPSLDLVRSLLGQRGPQGVDAHALFWSSYFRIHHRQVAQLRFGRIFLAGDAAHIHSPFGGQGMNTGLHDAWNLVWKLDLAVRGYARPALLDSYSAERRPVIKHVIEVTDLITKAMGTPSAFAQSIRDVAIPVVSQLAPFQHAFVQTLSQLGMTYAGSPVVEGRGNRYVDESLRGGGAANAFVLFLPEGSPASTQAQQLVHDIHDVLELRTAKRDGIALVRPDGYAAYESGRATESALTEIRALLERQTVMETPRERTLSAVR